MICKGIVLIGFECIKARCVLEAEFVVSYISTEYGPYGARHFCKEHAFEVLNQHAECSIMSIEEYSIYLAENKIEQS